MDSCKNKQIPLRKYTKSALCMNPHVNIRKKKTTDVLAKSEIKCITLTINTVHIRICYIAYRCFMEF